MMPESAREEMFRRIIFVKYQCPKCCEISNDPQQAREHYIKEHGVSVHLETCVRCGDTFHVRLKGQRVCEKRECFLICLGDKG